MPVKEGNLSCIFKQRETDIVLLQETHLDPVESEKQQSDWVGQIFFYSTSSSKTQGFEKPLAQCEQINKLYSVLTPQGCLGVVCKQASHPLKSGW